MTSFWQMVEWCGMRGSYPGRSCSPGMYRYTWSCADISTFALPRKCGVQYNGCWKLYIWLLWSYTLQTSIILVRLEWLGFPNSTLWFATSPLNIFKKRTDVKANDLGPHRFPFPTRYGYVSRGSGGLSSKMATLLRLWSGQKLRKPPSSSA